MNTFRFIALVITTSVLALCAIIQAFASYLNIMSAINSHGMKKTNRPLLVSTVVMAAISILLGIATVVFADMNTPSASQPPPAITTTATAVSGRSTFTPTPSPSASPTTPVTSACPLPIGSKLFYPIKSLTIPLGCVGVLTAVDGDINGQLWFQKGVLLAIPHGIYNGSFENGEFYFYSVDTANIQFCTLYHKLISDGNHVAKQLALPSWKTCL